MIHFRLTRCHCSALGPSSRAGQHSISHLPVPSLAWMLVLVVLLLLPLTGFISSELYTPRPTSLGGGRWKSVRQGFAMKWISYLSLWASFVSALSRSLCHPIDARSGLQCSLECKRLADKHGGKKWTKLLVPYPAVSATLLSTLRSIHSKFHSL